MEKQDVNKEIEIIDKNITSLKNDIKKLKLRKKELKPIFGIKDVVASVLCVDNKEDLKELTIGKKYTLIKKDKEHFYVKNNLGKTHGYFKYKFKKL